MTVIYGAARLIYTIAKDGELPEVRERKLMFKTEDFSMARHDPFNVFPIDPVNGAVHGQAR